MGAIKSNGKMGIVSGTQEETAGAQASFWETGSGSDRCRFFVWAEQKGGRSVFADG